MAIRIIDFAVGFQTDQVPNSAVAANTIAVTPSGNLASINVQAALVELQGDIDGLNTDIDEVNSDLVDLATADTELAGDIADLQAADATLASDIDALQAADTVLADDIADLIADLATKQDAATAANLAGIQTLLNKTLTSPLLVTGLVDNGIYLNHETSVVTPAAGQVAVYPKADNKLYVKDSTGLEKAIGSGSGAGEINLITASSESTGWTGTATVATDTTPTNFPLQGAIETALKISSAVSGQYREFAFSVPAALARKMKIELWFKHAGSVTDWKVELYKGGVKQALKTDVSGNSYVPAGSGRWLTDFDFEAASYTLRIVRAASIALDLYLQGVVVGPGLNAQGAAVGPPTSHIPVFTGLGAVSIVEAKYEVTGESIRLYGRASGGTATAVSVTMTLPNNWTANTPNIRALGHWWRNNGSLNQRKRGTFNIASNSNLLTFTLDDYATDISPFGSWIGTNLFGDNAIFSWEVTVPITQLAGSGTVNLGAGAQPTYAWNSSTSTTGDSSAFAYGEQGALLNAFAPTGTNSVAMVVRSPYPNPKYVTLQFKVSGRGWVNIDSTVFGFNSNGTTNYGAIITPVAGSSTDYAVEFFAQSQPGVGWSIQVGAGSRWRVVFADTPAAVGFGPATATESGLVSKEESGTFNVTATGAVTGTFAVSYSKVGRSVTLVFPDIISGGVAATALTLSGMPSRLAPLSNINNTAIVQNAAAYQVGNLEIGASGTIYITATPAAANFSNTGNQGLRRQSISYVSAT